MSTSTPHDDLFKVAFQIPSAAAGLLRSILPPALAAALDWRTLVLESGALQQQGGGERRNDLLFSVRVRGSRSRVYIPVEHQSTVERGMALRGLGYSAALWERIRTGTTERRSPRLRLPLVIPVLISNAPRGWTAPTSLHELFCPHPSRLPELIVPNLAFFVDDLQRRTNAELQARPLPPFQQLVLWALRDARSARRIMDALPSWGPVIRRAAQAPNASMLVTHLFPYIMERSKTGNAPGLSYDKFRAKLEEIVPEMKEPLMTWAEELRQQGIAQGIQQGSRETAQTALRLQLGRRFKQIPPDYEARIAAADVPQLQEWLVRFVDAKTLEAVFDD